MNTAPIESRHRESGRRSAAQGVPVAGIGDRAFRWSGRYADPAVVGDAIARTLTGPLSNRGTSIASERNADEAVIDFRAAIADLLGADPRGVVYGRSATQLTYDFSRALAKTWSEGDEIVVTQLDHDCNVRPWIQAAEARGVVVRWLRMDPATAELDLERSR